MDKTDPLRDGNSQLVISHRKSHSPVSSATISRWIKESLADAGVETDLFKAHSTRSVSTSAASKKGVMVGDIMATAGWSRNTTFERFYHKQIRSGFADTILKS